MKTPTACSLHRPAPVVWVACLVWLFAGLGSLNAGIVGQWDFTTGLTASTGIDLEYFDGPGGATDTSTQFGTTASFGISDVAGAVAHVMRVPKNTSAMGLAMNPNAAGNGGGVYVNQYSLVFDAYFPAASASKTRCLIQIDEPWANSNEGEFYVGAINGLGTSAKPQGVVTPDTWHRLVITVDLAATPPRAIKYIDGAKAGQETLPDILDGRWALGTMRALLFTDNAGASEVVYVNSIQVHDAVLSPGYVGALGAPAGDAIPVSVTPIAVVDELRPTPGDAFVMPGDAIEADLITAGQAIPEASVVLKLDGATVTPAISYPAAGVMRASYSPGNLAPESSHTVRLNYVDPVVGTNVQQVDWSFRMCPYHLVPPDPTTEGLLYLGFEDPTALDGDRVTDRSPSLNHGTVRLQAGVPDLTIAGTVSNALDFTINQTVIQNYVELTNGFGSVPNSFAAWVKVDSNFLAATRVGVMLGNYGVQNAINWEIHTSGRPRVYWGYNSGALVDWIVSDDLRSGQWEHIAFVRDPAQGFAYYRNGRLTATQTNAGPTVLPIEPPYLGTDRRASGFQPFKGALDEVTLFGRSLSSNEVFRLYTAPVNFPKFLFASPPITRLTPVEGVTGVAATARLEALVDESFSSNTVNLASVQMSINGTSVTPQAQRSGQTVRISYVPSPPLTPMTTNTVRVRYLDNASTPHETVRLWSFVTGPAPAIMWFSSGATMAVGEDVAFGVTAAGVPPITYQWRRNGVALTGETNTLLSLPAVTLAQAGSYDVVVSNPSGSVTSPAAELTVVSSLPLGGLLDGVRGYYPFETQVGGVVSNAARALGYAGFAQDEAILNGAEGDPSAILPPYTTNLAKVRAGTGALDCDGAGDYGDILGNPLIVGQDWAVAAWFKPDTGGLGYLTTGTRAFVFETSGTVYPISFGLRGGTAGNSNFQLFSDYLSGTDPSRDFQVANTNVDRWHQIIIVYRSANSVIEGWLDGALTHTITVTGTLNPNYSGFHLGTYRTGDARFFKGQMDELALWQRSLTTAEITNLYALGQQSQTLAARIGEPDGAAFQNNLVAYYSFDARTDWVVPNQAQAVGGVGFLDDALTMKGGYVDPAARIYPLTHNAALARVGLGALSGDGTNDYARINGNPVDPNQNWSVAAWFKPDTAGQGVTGTTRLFVWESSGTDNPPISYGLRAGTPDPGTGDPRTDFQVYTYSTTTAYFQDFHLLNPLVDQWHHAVVTYDAVNGVLKGYLDGAESHNFVLGPGTTLRSYFGLNLGTYRSADGRWFRGLIDEVAFWQRKLSPSAISQAYSLGNAGIPWITSVPTASFAPGTSPAGSFHLSWQALSGLTYSVQASSDLVDWSTTIATNLTATGGSIAIIISPTQPPPPNGYHDPGMSGAPQRFYRVRWDQ